MVVGYGSALAMALFWALVVAEPKWLGWLLEHMERRRADKAEEAVRRDWLAAREARR